MSTIKKIAFIYESILDTRSHFLKFFDNFYPNEPSKIRKVYLKIEKGSLEKSLININKIEKKKYFKALISFEDNGSFQKADYRLRGKNFWHHKLNKPSLRVKLQKREPFQMMRHVNFTSPEGRTAIENFYADYFSKKVGLVGHFSEMVELHINNVNYGIYHMHSREDESMVRYNQRMPGPLLLGKSLFEKWKIERFQIENLKSISKNKDIFSKMIKEINKKYTDWSSWDQFWDIVNFEQTAKHMALNSILGNLHNDYTHNHEFFYDRTTGKIEPIISDAMSLGTYVYPWGRNRISLDTIFLNEKPDFLIPINQKTNPFFNHLIKNTEFYHSRNIYIKSFLEKELSLENQEKFLDIIYNKINPTMYKDQYKKYITGKIGGWNVSEYSNLEYEIFKKNVYEFIKKRNLFLKDRLNQNLLEINYINFDQKLENSNYLMIKYKGELPIILNQKEFGKKIKVYDPKLKKFRENDQKILNIHTGLKIIKNSHKFTNISSGEDIFHKNHYTTDFQTYILKLDKKIDQKRLFKIFENNLNKAKLKIKFNPPLNFKSYNDIIFNNNTLHIWSKRNEYFDKNIILGPGSVEIKENLIIKKNQKLIINDGTKILMWPGISIFSEGKVEILGDKAGVVITRKFKDKSWGNFSIIGKDSSSSFIKNTKINGGSISDLKNIIFSGMLSIFWNNNILLENVELYNNEIGDDTLHITKSSGTINNLKVSNCFSDCIDFDYSNYTINNLTSLNSINDGLDLMETKIKGKKLLFINALDKGISVGENSNLLAEDVIIKKSNIGIASKDNSRVNINNIGIYNCLVGVDTYRKNLRYSFPGTIKLVNQTFRENQVDISAENLAYIKFNHGNLNVMQK